jgi:phosphopantothenoylcysteine decarboxylase/phosphopantothenate--cysteine ligase
MGYALAEAAREAGARVTLISGPVSLSVPDRVDNVPVVSAQEMHDAVMRNMVDCDIFLAVAAVSDYRCEMVADHKAPKQETMMLKLESNPDILAEVGKLNKPPFTVGFAAETHDVIAKAAAKRERKSADLIIANRVGNGLGMYSDDNAVTVLGKEIELAFPLTPKHQLARQLIAVIAEQFRNRNRQRGKTNAA